MKKICLSVITSLILIISTCAVVASEQAEVTHLARAIQFPTVSFQNTEDIDYSHFSQFHAFLRETYPLVFTQLKVETIAQYSLFINWKGSNKALKPVLFDAHYDVVPIEPGTESDWKYPPFGGVIADGFIWGRGSLDDKVSVIATLEAIETLLQQGYAPQRSLLFSFAHDEEIGGKQGAANIAAHMKKKGIQLEYMIGEGGFVLEDNPLLPGKTTAMIALAEKTYISATLTARGDGGHSSTPPKNNAIIRLAKAVTALHENPFEAKLVAPVNQMLEAMAPHIDGVQGFLFRNQWLSEPLILLAMSKDRTANALVRTTTAVTMFNAGIKENQVSQQAQAIVNFRLLPGLSTEQFLEDIKNIVDDDSIEIKTQQWNTNPPISDMNGLGYQHISSAVSDVLPGVVVIPSLLTATTDTPYYIELTKQIYRFHPFTFPIEDVSKVHSTNERISVNSIINAVKISTALIQTAANP